MKPLTPKELEQAIMQLDPFQSPVDCMEVERDPMKQMEWLRGDL